MAEATELAHVAPLPFDQARVAVAGFLAGYNGRTREAYILDLRMWSRWCEGHGLELLDVERPHIELWARSLEEEGKARATVGRRLSTLVSFYRYCEVEGVIARSPAAHVRRPRIDMESTARGLDRMELGAFLAAANVAGGTDNALACLLGLNGLRVSEAIGADVEGLGFERGHRTIRIVGKGSKAAVAALSPRTARAIDLAVGERSEGPILLSRSGGRMNRQQAARIVRRLSRRAGISPAIGPHALRHAFITAALDAGVALRDVQTAARHADPRTTMRYDRARHNLDRHATYVVTAFVAGAG